MPARTFSQFFGLLIAIATIRVFAFDTPQSSVVVARDPSQAAEVSQEAPALGTAAISGRILDAGTNVPIAGALVRLTPIGGSGVFQSVLCDSQGRFVFLKVPGGVRYAIEAERAGFSSAVYGLPDPGGADAESRAAVVQVAPKEWRRDVEISLRRLVNITGRVFDDHHEPLVGVAVRAFSVTTLGSRRYLASVALASTDDLGAYRLMDLGPGEYLVGVVNSQASVLAATPEVAARRPVGALISGGPPDRGPAAVGAPTLAPHHGYRLVVNSLSASSLADGGPRAYALVYFPSARSPADAQTLVLTPAGGRSDVDFYLQPVHLFRVSGRTTSFLEIRNAPLLRLLPRGHEELGLGNEVATTQLGADGTFTFLGVPPGDYTLIANAGGQELARVKGSDVRLPHPPGTPDASTGSDLVAGTSLRVFTRSGAPSSVWARQPISVGHEDLDEVPLVLHPTRQIRGRIEIDADGGPALSVRGIQVTAQPIDRDPTIGSSAVYVERGPGPMMFSLEGLSSGTYVLGASSLSVQSVTWQGREVADTGIGTSAGDVEEVVLTLTSRTTEVTGVVTGRTDADARTAVIAFPVDPNLWGSTGWTPRRLRFVFSRADGTYSLRGLPAGEYYLIAVEERLASRWTDPRFLRSAVARATRVAIAWGTRSNADLPLRREPPQ